MCKTGAVLVTLRKIKQPKKIREKRDESCGFLGGMQNKLRRKE